MKNILVIGLLVMMLAACGQYQKVLGGDNIKAKYELLTQYYKEGLETGKKSRFKRALRLLEQILPQYRGKPQGERLAFMYANSYYQIEAYSDAGYQFERFTKSYPRSDKIQEAAFKSAKSFYYTSPRYSLDQTFTHTALKKLQHYITTYPGGAHVGEANQLVSELRDKLDKKDFEIAKLYYDQSDWKAAIAAMDNFINENPGSPFLEKAYFYRLKAEYILAINSYRNVMEERLEKSKKYSKDYLSYYSEGKYVDEVKPIYEDVTNRLKKF